MKLFAPFLLLLILASCQSKTVTKEISTVPPSKPAAPAVEVVPDFKFSFHVSGSGLNYKPSDSFLMDTNGMMAVNASRKIAAGKFEELHALAQLEPQDFDTLKTIIMKGKLYEIDSMDVTEQCPEDEMYRLDIVPLVDRKPVRLSYYACAADYNLLLQPQRKYFRLLFDWWERMRVKYRPAKAE